VYIPERKIVMKVMKAMKSIVVFAILSISICACAHENSGRADYPTRTRHAVEQTADDAQESTYSLYEENKEWVKEKAAQAADTVVDYTAAGVAKATQLKEDFKRKVEKYSNK